MMETTEFDTRFWTDEGRGMLAAFFAMREKTPFPDEISSAILDRAAEQFEALTEAYESFVGETALCRPDALTDFRDLCEDVSQPNERPRIFLAPERFEEAEQTYCADRIIEGQGRGLFTHGNSFYVTLGILSCGAKPLEDELRLKEVVPARSWNGPTYSYHERGALVDRGSVRRRELHDQISLRISGNLYVVLPRPSVIAMRDPNAHQSVPEQMELC